MSKTPEKPKKRPDMTGKKYRKSGLTPAKKKFAQVYAKTDNATEAVRQAYPEVAAITSPEYQRLKAHRLITNDNIQAEVEYQKGKIALLASKAVNKFDKLLDSDDEAISLSTGKFVFEHIHGKPVQKSTSLSVQFTSTLGDTQV